MNELGIPVIVSTDAHAPDDLIKSECCEEFLRSIGYKEIVTRLS
jgi:histidinol phosphatase-like PHP family hydrolase